MAVTKGLASVTVTIGNSRRMTFETNSRSPLSYFEVPFDRHTTGPVMLTLNGRTTTGAEIRTGCEDSVVGTLAKHKRLETYLAKLTVRLQASLNAVAIQV
jgi:glucan endo-1,3-alpha-glucosidase